MTLLGMERKKARAAARRMAALGLASGLSLLADGATEAAIVYVDEQATIDVTSNPSYTLSVDGIDFVFNTTYQGDPTKFIYASSVNAGAATSAQTAVVVDGTYAAPLSLNALIGGSSNFGGLPQNLGNAGYKSNLGASLAGFATTGSDYSYLGLRFSLNDGTHYGWVAINDHISFDSTGTVPTGETVTINGFAYETTAGASINAGEKSNTPPSVPEPASLLQLAMGAAGLAGLSATRRRRTRAV